MKTIKPIMLVVAGMAIAFLVSFKSQEPVKEYATITSKNTGISLKLSVVKPGSPSGDETSSNIRNVEVDLTNKINKLSTDGWVVVSTINYSPEVCSVILERTKQ